MKNLTDLVYPKITEQREIKGAAIKDSEGNPVLNEDGKPKLAPSTYEPYERPMTTQEQLAYRLKYFSEQDYEIQGGELKSDVSVITNEKGGVTSLKATVLCEVEFNPINGVAKLVNIKLGIKD